MSVCLCPVMRTNITSVYKLYSTIIVYCAHSLQLHVKCVYKMYSTLGLRHCCLSPSGPVCYTLYKVLLFSPCVLHVFTCQITVQVDLENRMKALQDIIVKSSVVDKPQGCKTKVRTYISTCTCTCT